MSISVVFCNKVTVSNAGVRIRVWDWVGVKAAGYWGEYQFHVLHTDGPDPAVPVYETDTHVTD